MPMIPSAAAAVVYAAVKVAGYTVFAHGLSKASGQAVSPIKFGGAKTALGLISGVTYVFGLAPTIGIHEASDAALFFGAAPVRLAVWVAVIGFFYGFRENPKLMGAAVFFGVVWSYVLDGAMWVIYKILPGMVMPFC